jgi:copper(I)-binding protein
MDQDSRRRLILQSGLLIAIGARAAHARACEYVTQTMRIVHPWTRATAPEAEHAVMCMTFADVVEDDRLVGVETPVAGGSNLPAGGLAIPAGQELVLSERGTHVRLTGLRQGLEVGRSYPLALHFAKGGQVLATLNVDFMRFR